MSHKYSTAWLTSHTQHTAHATLAQSQDIVQIIVYTYNVWTTVAPVLFFHAWGSGGRVVLDGGPTLGREVAMQLPMREGPMIGR